MHMHRQRRWRHSEQLSEQEGVDVGGQSRPKLRLQLRPPEREAIDACTGRPSRVLHSPVVREGRRSGQAHPCHEPKRRLPRRPPALQCEPYRRSSESDSRSLFLSAASRSTRCREQEFEKSCPTRTVRAAGRSGRGNPGTAMCSARTFSSDAPHCSVPNATAHGYSWG